MCAGTGCVTVSQTLFLLTLPRKMAELSLADTTNKQPVAVPFALAFIFESKMKSGRKTCRFFCMEKIEKSIESCYNKF